MSSGQTRLLPTEKIEVADRLRPIDNNYVQHLATSMEQDGLDHPIVVRPARKPGHWRVVAGAHRLAAARHLGWQEIEAKVREDLADDDSARLVEITENLMRRDLSKLDRAIFVCEWRKAMIRLHPELGSRGGDRKSGEFLWKQQTAQRAVWSEVASQVGLSERSVRGYRKLVEALHPETIALIRLTPVAENVQKLKELAGTPDRRAQIDGARRLVAGQAQPKETKKQRSDDDLYLALTKAWFAAPVRVRNRFTREVLESGEQ